MDADHQKSAFASKRGVPKCPFGELYVLHFQTDDFFKTKFCGKQEKVSILLNNGVPMGLQFSITGIGIVMLQSANNALGTIYVAAFTASMRIKYLFTCLKILAWLWLHTADRILVQASWIE